MSDFTETPICKSRANCFQCRNNENFRNQMVKQYGEWECPEGIKIGAKVEELPEKAQQTHKRMLEANEKRKKQIEEIKSSLDELRMIVPPEGNKIIDKITGLVFPDMKTPERCKHGGKKIGEVDQECCGGKIEKKAAFQCGKHTITTEKKCMTCEDYES